MPSASGYGRAARIARQKSGRLNACPTKARNWLSHTVAQAVSPCALLEMERDGHCGDYGYGPLIQKGRLVHPLLHGVGCGGSQ